MHDPLEQMTCCSCDGKNLGCKDVREFGKSLILEVIASHLKTSILPDILITIIEV